MEPLGPVIDRETEAGLLQVRESAILSDPSTHYFWDAAMDRLNRINCTNPSDVGRPFPAIQHDQEEPMAFVQQINYSHQTHLHAPSLCDRNVIASFITSSPSVKADIPSPLPGDALFHNVLSPFSAGDPIFPLSYINVPAHFYQ